MDNSREFRIMLTDAIISEPQSFVGFDRTKNVQDQLQEMVKGVRGYWEIRSYPEGKRLKEEEPFELLVYTEHGVYELVAHSMEQLWLSFVMYELHSKKWDGDKWV